MKLKRFSEHNNESGKLLKNQEKLARCAVEQQQLTNCPFSIGQCAVCWLTFPEFSNISKFTAFPGIPVEWTPCIVQIVINTPENSAEESGKKI